MKTRARHSATLLVLLSLPAVLPAATAGDAFAPLRFLVGHCWKGAFPDGKTTDEHCFSWLYGGKFMRDEHTVRSGGAPVARGETTYLWDEGLRQLQYLYIENGGGFSRGTVTSEGSTLVFPESAYHGAEGVQSVRSRWQRSGSDAYDVNTEFRGKDGWSPGFSVHMLLASDLPRPAAQH
jgi:hypothetical protein